MSDPLKIPATVAVVSIVLLTLGIYFYTAVKTWERIWALNKPEVSPTTEVKFLNPSLRRIYGGCAVSQVIVVTVHLGLYYVTGGIWPFSQVVIDWFLDMFWFSVFCLLIPFPIMVMAERGKGHRVWWTLTLCAPTWTVYSYSYFTLADIYYSFQMQADIKDEADQIIKAFSYFSGFAGGVAYWVVTRRMWQVYPWRLDEFLERVHGLPAVPSENSPAPPAVETTDIQ